MPLHDYNLANQTPASYRTDHNNLNLAIAGQNASSSGITTTFAHMMYADVSSSGWMRQRNAADSTFNYLYLLDAPGGLATYAGNPSTNHAAKYQGQPLYDTANNAFYIATLAGTSSQATWAQVQFSSSINTGYPTKYMQGLMPKYASVNSITIQPGVCRDDSDSANIAISTAYTVSITVSGAGGLSTSETESTSGAFYYCFAIRKSTDGTVNFMLTASSSGPVLPSGYNQKRLLPFAVRNTTQADFLPFYVADGWPSSPKVYYDTDFDGTASDQTSVGAGLSATSFTTLSVASYVPPISQRVCLHYEKNSIGSVSFRPAGSTYTNGFRSYQYDNAMDETLIRTSTAQVIEYKVSNGSLDVAVRGYVVSEV